MFWCKTNKKVIIAPEKRDVWINISPSKTYVVVTLYKCLSEALLMSTYNKFSWRNKKNINTFCLKKAPGAVTYPKISLQLLTLRGSCKKFCHWIRVNFSAMFYQTYFYYKPSK